MILDNLKRIYVRPLTEMFALSGHSVGLLKSFAACRITDKYIMEPLYPMSTFRIYLKLSNYVTFSEHQTDRYDSKKMTLDYM